MKSLILLPVVVVSAALAHNLAGGSVVAADAPAAVAGTAQAWAVDPGHSSVMFRVKHANAAWFQGNFDRVEGSLVLDPAKPETGKVELTIPVESIDTNDQKRDGHLKAPDFFNAKENPNITFVGSKIEKKGDTTYLVTGELAMAGKSKTMTIAVEKTGEGEFYGKREGWLASFSINRSDFGMTYGIAQGSLGDEVVLTIALETVQPKK
jgi:polyisoprenoid-binding protein YceI